MMDWKAAASRATLTQRRTHVRGLGIFVFGLLFIHTVAGQVLERDLLRIIGVDAWSPEERVALEKGEVVVRSLETAGKQELAAIGILRIRNFPAVSMDKFRESLSQKNNEERMSGGRFGDPPRIEDLYILELEADALDELKKCTVGRCDLNLSAEMITRFQREIDWMSPEAKAGATRLIKEMLVAYARGYFAQGDRALGTYDNRRKAVELAESHRSLLSSSSQMNYLAPEFVEYLGKFPAAKLEDVESSLHWSVVDFGLKPSITISHAAAYTQTKGEYTQLLLASKQIYSSRYLDSSLTFTLLLSIVTETGVDSYLVFIDRSRSDALEGPLGGFARNIVRKESLARIKTLLDKAHLRLLAVGAAGVRSDAGASEDDSSVSWLAAIRERPIAVAIACLAVAAAILFFWQRKRASRTNVRRLKHQQEENFPDDE